MVGSHDPVSYEGLSALDVNEDFLGQENIDVIHLMHAGLPRKIT